MPSVAAGAIIGKGGETIAQLQKETTARVKMSKSHDFYPGNKFSQSNKRIIMKSKIFYSYMLYRRWFSINFCIFY